jgi:hypothetical protein
MTDGVVDALARSRVWLASTGTHPAASSRHALQALLGVWVCDRALGEDSSELRRLAARARAQIEAEPFDPYAHDPKLLLICRQVLARGGDVPAELEAFADEVALALAALERIPPKHAGLAAVLDELGFLRAPVIDVHEPTFDSLLRGGADAVRAACGSVAAATRFGARGTKLRFEALRSALPVLFLQTLRAYDLDTAAMLLRASRYLRMAPSDRLDEGIAFLVDQQKQDGRFGYFAVEATALVESQEIAGFDEVLTLSLPVTSTCVWALAEVLSETPVLFERRRAKEERWSLVS